MTIEQLKQADNIITRLKPISQKLTKLDTANCNGELTDIDYERKSHRALVKAQEIMKNTDLKVYHQSNPRGCSLYIIDNTMNSSTYNRGFAILR